MPDVLPVVSAPNLSGPDADVLSEILSTIRSVQRDIRTVNRVPVNLEAAREQRLYTMITDLAKRMQREGVLFKSYIGSRDGMLELHGEGHKERVSVDELEMILKDDALFSLWINVGSYLSDRLKSAHPKIPPKKGRRLEATFISWPVSS